MPTIYELLEYSQNQLERIKQTEERSKLDSYKQDLTVISSDMRDWQMLQKGEKNARLEDRVEAMRVEAMQEKIKQALKEKIKQPDQPPPSLHDLFREAEKRHKPEPPDHDRDR